MYIGMYVQKLLPIGIAQIQLIAAQMSCCSMRLGSCVIHANLLFQCGACMMTPQYETVCDTVLHCGVTVKDILYYIANVHHFMVHVYYNTFTAAVSCAVLSVVGM